MLIPRDVLDRWVQLKSPPSLPCPRCNRTLARVPDSSLNAPDMDAEGAYRYGGEQPDVLRGHTGMLYKCSSSQCEQKVIVLGDDCVADEFDPDAGHNTWTSFIKIRYCQPVVPAFAIPEETPDGIKKGLGVAFSHVFSDASACGNALRSVVERILDDRGVRKTEIKNHRRRFLALHRRIELLEVQQPEFAEYLEAIKWIGNDASHGSGVNFDEIYAALEIIENVVTRLYSREARRLHQTVKRVIRANRSPLR